MKKYSALTKNTALQRKVQCIDQSTVHSLYIMSGAISATKVKKYSTLRISNISTAMLSTAHLPKVQHTEYEIGSAISSTKVKKLSTLI